MKKILTTPIKAEDLQDIRVGDVIYLTGTLVTCRDVCHRRLIELKRPIPYDLNGKAIFHAGPIVRKNGDKWEMVSVGPTADRRRLPEIQGATCDFPGRLRGAGGNPGGRD